VSSDDLPHERKERLDDILSLCFINWAETLEKLRGES
jgi:hypothetical protein